MTCSITTSPWTSPISLLFPALKLDLTPSPFHVNTLLSIHIGIPFSLIVFIHGIVFLLTYFLHLVVLILNAYYIDSCVLYNNFFVFLFNCICYYSLLLCLLCVSISVPVLVAICFLYLGDTPIGLFPFVFTLPPVVKPIKIKIKLIKFNHCSINQDYLVAYRRPSSCDQNYIIYRKSPFWFTYRLLVEIFAMRA